MMLSTKVQQEGCLLVSYLSAIYLYADLKPSYSPPESHSAEYLSSQRRKGTLCYDLFKISTKSKLARSSSSYRVRVKELILEAFLFLKGDSTKQSNIHGL